MDYYKLLEIERSASKDVILEAIKKQRRNWNQRANSPKAEIRAQAEKNIAVIREAETVLLDADKRAKYDKELVSKPNVEQTAPIQSPPEGRDWLKLTVEYFLSNNYNAMNYAAREATTQNPNSADAWYWRGVSSSRIGNKRDADYELHEAIRINPSDASYFGELGDLYCFADLHTDAVGYYRQAIALENTCQYYYVALGRSLHLINENAEALTHLEYAYKINPNDDFCKFWYTIVLQAITINSWSKYSDNYFSLTSEAQVAFTKEQLELIHKINCTEPDVVAEINQMEKLVKEAEEIKWHKPHNLKWYVGAALIGLGLLDPAPFIGLSILGGAIALLIFLNRVPGWKWNKRCHALYEISRGI